MAADPDPSAADFQDETGNWLPPIDEEDYGGECGRWHNGRLRQECSMAGTEFCDWDCPYS